MKISTYVQQLVRKLQFPLSNIYFFCWYLYIFFLLFPLPHISAGDIILNIARSRSMYILLSFWNIWQVYWCIKCIVIKYESKHFRYEFYRHWAPNEIIETQKSVMITSSGLVNIALFPTLALFITRCVIPNIDAIILPITMFNLLWSFKNIANLNI